jgi:hypothetical protein
LKVPYRICKVLKKLLQNEEAGGASASTMDDYEQLQADDCTSAEESYHNESVSLVEANLKSSYSDIVIEASSIILPSTSHQVYSEFLNRSDMSPARSISSTSKLVSLASLSDVP